MAGSGNLHGRINPPPERRCTATRRDGTRCREWTRDPRINVCFYHGGGGFNRRTGEWAGRSGWLVTGRYSKAVANIPQLEELYQRVLAEDDLTETTEEIALLRAMLSRWIERSTSAMLSGETLPIVADIVDKVDKLIDRRHKRLHGTNLTITVKDWEALLTRVFDLTHQFFGQQENYAEFVRAVANMHQPKTQLIEGKATEVSDAE